MRENQRLIINDAHAPIIPIASRSTPFVARQISMPIARVLPPTESSPPKPVAFNHVIPSAVGVVSFGYVATALAINGHLFAHFMAPLLLGSMAWFTAYVIAWMIQLFKQSQVEEQWRYTVEREFGAPYTRYRVQSYADGTNIVLQLVAYEPQHTSGQRPSYQSHVVEEERFDATDEIAVFEGLEELREAARERESVANEGWESVLQALELQERVLSQLPSTPHQTY